MSSQPTIVERPEQPYAAKARSITMDTFPEIADRLPEVLDWLDERGIDPVGPPFFRYDVIDMECRLGMQAGVPVPAALDDDGDVRCGVLPAGRYATVTHVGHPSELVEVTRQLLDWAAGEGHKWDSWDTPDGEAWGCRLELLLTDPDEEPDMSKWATQLMFRLAD